MSPFGDMDEAAIATHEIFRSYVRAGFTRNEALQITIHLMTAKMKELLEDNDGQHKD